MNLPMLRRFIAAAVVVLVPLAADWAGALRPLENTLTTLRMQLAPRAASGQIALVDIDARTIAAVGAWPWPRRVHAALVDRLVALGAAEIALDIELSVPSDPENDAELAAALDRAEGSVILAAFVQGLTSETHSELVLNRPLDLFAARAWMASTNVRPDPDGIVRRSGYGVVIGSETVPSLATVLSGAIGEYGRDFAIDFSIDPRGIDRISLLDVLSGSVDGARISGKKIIVGASAAELRDFFNTPVTGVVSGSLLQALAAETLLQGRALTETSPVAALIGLSILGLVTLLWGRRSWRLAVGFAVLAALIIEEVATLAQATAAVAIDTSPWQLGCLLFALAALLSELDVGRVLQNLWHSRAVEAGSILARVVADNFAGVVVIGDDGRVRTASRSATEILGLPGDFEGKRAADMLPATLLAEVGPVLAKPVVGGANRRSGEVSFIRPDGEERILDYVVTLSRLGDLPETDRRISDRQWVACVSFTDITQRKADEARIFQMAHFDALTGLPNRVRLLGNLEAAVARNRTSGRACAVVCFDLDGFKNVNDTLGHLIGDQLLRQVAERAAKRLPEGGLAARLGGDEFAAIIEGATAGEAAMAYAKDLIEAIAEPFNVDGHRVIIAASIGVAVSVDPTASTALMHADIALYRAKSNGGNQVVKFEPAMLAAIAERRRLELDLWRALDRNQLELLYQPQIDLGDGSLVGAEALLRWNHPDRGTISPGEFVPIAEATGLIDHLGRWVLEEACMEAAGWSESIRLAVNVSSIQFARCDVVEMVRRALAKSGLPARRLELEITESLLMQSNAAALETLVALRSIGVGIAIDDFGTGYSSLSYIQRFPIDKIKIDRSFVSGLPDDRDSLAVLKAIVSIANNLDIRLNAEGIETVAQQELLTHLGVKEGQGFLFAAPERAAKFTERLGGSPLARLRA